jgi:hypothetical protein
LLGISSSFHYDNPENDAQFDGILSAADIVISCRKQDRGQLSHIIPKSFNFGKPVLTNSRSGLSMIRKDCLINEDAFEENLIEKLIYFLNNRHILREISTFNRNLFESEHNMTHYFNNILDVSAK